MSRDPLDGMLDHAPDLPSGLAERIRSQIRQDTKPVKPLAGVSHFTLLFLGVFAIISFLVALVTKLKALNVLTVGAAIVLLLTLYLAALFSATAIARSMRPASGRLYTWPLAMLAFAAYEALVFHLFNDYSTTLFVHYGSVCLFLGTLCAVLTAIPTWLILRQGFIVDPTRAGATVGLISGLAGLTALTLHCPILTVPHTAIWHAAVLVVAVGAGALVGSRAK